MTRAVYCKNEALHRLFSARVYTRPVGSKLRYLLQTTYRMSVENVITEEGGLLGLKPNPTSRAISLFQHVEPSVTMMNNHILGNDPTVFGGCGVRSAQVVRQCLVGKPRTTPEFEQSALLRRSP